MIEKILSYARTENCSDVHLTHNMPPIMRKLGNMIPINDVFPNLNIEKVIYDMLSDEQMQKVEKHVDIDFCYTMETGERQRVNVYYQQGHICAALRLLNDKIPTIDELQLPKAFKQLAQMPNGLVLVTGPTGSGKSTSLAAVIDYINQNTKCHIITMEDPIEYLHPHKNSVVHQREVGSDCMDFGSALRSSLREDPDVILVGEMRDLETISAAITAAETGHLVLSTLHTIGAADTINRIIDVFPSGAKDQIRSQLSTCLRGVITQQLVPLADQSARCAAFEVMLANEAVANLIRENKCFQVNSVLQTTVKDGMFSLNYDLARLVNMGKISLYDAMSKSTNRVELSKYLE